MHQKKSIFVLLLLMLTLLGTTSHSWAKTTRAAHFWGTGSVSAVDHKMGTVTIQLNAAGHRLAADQIGEHVEFPISRNVMIWQCSAVGHNPYGGGYSCWAHKGKGCWNYGNGSGCGLRSSSSDHDGDGDDHDGDHDRDQTSKRLHFSDLRPGDTVNLMGSYNRTTHEFVVSRIECITY